MEIEKLKRWLELAQHYQIDGFWNQIFQESREKTSAAPPKNLFSLSQEYFPKCDLYEANGELVMEMEAPGLTKDAVNISLNQQILRISGEFKTLRQPCTYFLKERANRKFTKELTLPYPVLENQSSSELVNGLLTVRLPINRDEIENIPISFSPDSPE